MVTSADLVRGVAEALSLPEATVGSYYRVLREGGLVTKGGRGRSAPAMSTTDAARLLIALLSSDALAEGAAATELIGQLEFGGFFPRTDEALLIDPDYYSDDDPSDFDGVEEEPVLFERALSELIEFIMPASSPERPHLTWLPTNSWTKLEVTVTATKLWAVVRLDDSVANFGGFDLYDTVTDPNEWESMTIKERLQSRALIGGMAVSRTISSIELSRIAKLLA